MLIDSHTHLIKSYYEDIPEIIKKANISGVNLIINIGCESNTLREVMNNSYENVYPAIGIHPSEITETFNTDLQYIEANILKIVAVGEIGLDYHYEGFDKAKQITAFKRQLDLAKKYNKPVIIHSRDAFLDTYEVLKDYKLKGVIHSFSGSLEDALKYLELGFYLGINGVITFKNSNLKEIIKKIPLDKILLETDAPFLAPEPYRGTKNESSHILEIAKFIANLKEVSLDEVAKVTSVNVCQLFNIKIN